MIHDSLVLQPAENKGLPGAINKEEEQDEAGGRSEIRRTKEHIELQVGIRKEQGEVCGQVSEEEMDEKAKEALNDFKLELVSSQPVLNAYVSTSLEKQLLEMMSIEGFEFPDMLTDLREDIDFGLFSVNLSDHLGIILEAEVDPFEELGIEI